VTSFHTASIRNNLAPSSFYSLQCTRWDKTFLQNVGIHYQNYKAQGSNCIWQQTFVTYCHYSAVHIRAGYIHTIKKKQTGSGT
jgi:hypothetical protein